MVFILSPRIFFPLGVNPRMQNQVCYIKARYLSLVCVFTEILPMTLPSVSIKIIWLLTHAEPTSVPKRHFTNTPFHHYHLATCAVIKASLVSFTFWYSIVMVCLKWCQSVNTINCLCPLMYAIGPRERNAQRFKQLE